MTKNETGSLDGKIVDTRTERGVPKDVSVRPEKGGETFETVPRAIDRVKSGVFLPQKITKKMPGNQKRKSKHGPNYSLPKCKSN